MGMAVSYCLYVLSLREFKKNEEVSRNKRPGEMEIFARVKPPVIQLK